VSQEEEITVSIRVALHESHGQWQARAEDAPGIEVHGSNKHEVLLKAKALALRVVADRTESEIPPRPVSIHPCDKFA
jgi:hypothetical protein